MVNERIRNYVLRYCIKLSKTKEKGEDLFMDTMHKFYSNTDVYNPEKGTLPTFLCTVARHIFIDKKRRKSLDIQRFQKDKEKDYAMSYGVSYIDYDSEDVINAIMKAVANIEGNIKYSMILYVNGYSYKEISRELDIPLSSVKSHVFRSKKQIRKRLLSIDINGYI